jgi:hypothetical protein
MVPGGPHQQQQTSRLVSGKHDKPTSMNNSNRNLKTAAASATMHSCTSYTAYRCLQALAAVHVRVIARCQGPDSDRHIPETPARDHTTHTPPTQLNVRHHTHCYCCCCCCCCCRCRCCFSSPQVGGPAQHWGGDSGAGGQAALTAAGRPRPPVHPGARRGGDRGGSCRGGRRAQQRTQGGWATGEAVSWLSVCYCKQRALVQLAGASWGCKARVTRGHTRPGDG